ncbi:hypothetical protein GCM10009632_26540 [Mycolicibacterium alvei]|uniref:Uncharacterized protein n=1 Tax=Mycolicibacterium alvei TaxID=67081 RepID=A0A6N4UZ29_9MYCO|nr:hypothetical protein MALV_47530 [Mycolicibacterium alvei]
MFFRLDRAGSFTPRAALRAKHAAAARVFEAVTGHTVGKVELIDEDDTVIRTRSAE